MTVELLRRLWKEQPFHPFNIHIADGRTIPVKHQEFLMPSPTGRTAAIYQPDGSCNIVDLLLVTDLEIGVYGKSGGGPKRKRKGNGSETKVVKAKRKPLQQFSAFSWSYLGVLASLAVHILYLH